MIKFEIGKIYSMKSVGISNCVWKYEIISRTDHTITFKNLFGGEIRKRRINKELTELAGYECVYALGKYLRCPILKAKNLI